MTKYRAEKNIPIPSITGKENNRKGQFGELANFILALEIGDSFVVGSKEEKLNAISRGIKHIGKGAIVTRSLGNGTYRIWRVK